MNKKILTLAVIVLVLPVTVLILDSIRISPKVSYFINLSDYSDDRVMVGEAHSVSVAKITAHVSSESLSGIPAEQFLAEIVSNLKGDSSGKIIINQFPEGDVFSESGNSYGSEGLLKPGSTYILALLYDPERNWFGIISHPNAYTLVSDDPSLSLAQLEEAVKKSDKYAKLVEALKDPISPEEAREERERLTEEYQRAHGIIEEDGEDEKR